MIIRACSKEECQSKKASVLFSIRTTCDSSLSRLYLPSCYDNYRTETLVGSYETHICERQKFEDDDGNTLSLNDMLSDYGILTFACVALCRGRTDDLELLITV